MPSATLVLAIAIWTRGVGDFTDFNDVPKVGTHNVDVQALSEGEFEGLDIQYGQKAKYRGVSLASIVAAAPPQGGADLAILHFANGMVIPLPLGDLSRDTRNTVVVATSIFYEGKWITRFPALAKPDPLFRDPRPVRFSWNKLVTSGDGFAAVTDRQRMGFSPWRHADSLVAIEYADRTAYYNQFRAPKGADSGRQVFMERCQFCHGIRGIGADFGWDFIKPLPIAEKRDDQSLLFHVKYKKLEAVERGLMMPNQKDFKAADAHALRLWLKALQPNGPNPYAP